MIYSNTDFKKKTILITGGAGFIGSNLAFYFQENYPNSHIVIFDCFRSEATFSNGNLQSFGHYKNLIGFTGDVVCGNINSKSDLALLLRLTGDLIEIPVTALRGKQRRSEAASNMPTATTDPTTPYKETTTQTTD